jgi:hypothetical protein
VLSIKLIYLELLISHFIRPVESAELPNVARVSKSLKTPDINDKPINMWKKYYFWGLIYYRERRCLLEEMEAQNLMEFYKRNCTDMSK